MKKLMIVLFFSIVFSSVNCVRDKNPITPDDVQFSTYPLKIGTQWEYKRIICSTNFRPTEENKELPQDSSIALVVLKITKEHTVHDSIKTHVFHETLSEGDHQYTDESYYANSKDGLLFYGYENAGFVIPKTNTSNQIMFGGKYFNSKRELFDFIAKATSIHQFTPDSIIYELPPLLVIAYPLKPNKEWIYRSPGKPWYILKKVVGQENVSVPAGDFYCYKIQWFHDTNHDSEWDEHIIFYDYVCSKGLIKRIVTIKDSQINSETGEPIGLVDFNDESVLVKARF